MAKVGIFFGTDTGNTRKVAKSIHKLLGDEVADKPVNINKASVDDLLAYDVLIIGSPTYGDGELPGLSSGIDNESWEEFLPKLEGSDFAGKTVAIFGLGDQVGYGSNFVDAIGFLYDAFSDVGAEIIGFTSTEGYEFKHSKGTLDDQFMGLALDEDNQKDLSEARLSAWISDISAAWA